MNLSKEQVSNLALLADFMEGLNDPRFTMRQYRHDCKTPACAFGHACTVPALVAKGLRFELTAGGAFEERFTMMRDLFGEDSYNSLFKTALQLTIKTPQQWAAHCRAFLKENGYDTKPDPFKTFMDRALEPVEIEIRETS